jgi:perosamine synthetase
MVVTNDALMDERLRLYRGQGVDTSVHRYYHKVVGYNYRLTNVQAAIGCAQMESLDEKLQRRKEIALQYRLRFMEARDSGIQIQAHRHDIEHANWMVSILIPTRVSRNRFMLRLDRDGIETRPVFQCMHRLPMYKSDDVFYWAQDISDRGVNLPTHPAMTPADVDRVVDLALAALR